MLPATKEKSFITLTPVVISFVKTPPDPPISKAMKKNKYGTRLINKFNSFCKRPLELFVLTGMFHTVISFGCRLKSVAYFV